MIDLAIQRLILYFPDSDFAEAKRARYNRSMDLLYNEVLDFICLHYALGNRRDSQYWIDAREALAVPDRLAENLELWKLQPPGPLDLATGHLFDYPTYQAVLMGKRVYDTGYGDGAFHRRSLLRREAWQAHLRASDARRKATLAACADHRQGLLAIRGEAEPQPRSAGLPGLGGARVATAPRPAGTVDTAAPGLF